LYGVTHSDLVPVNPDVVLRELQLTTSDIIDTNKFSGYNFTVGFKLDGEKLDVGLVLRTPFTLNVKTGRSIFLIQRRGAPGADMTVFFTDTTYYDNLLSKYEMPLMVNLGLAYKFSENFLTALDVSYRKFSGAKVQVRDSLFIDPGGKNIEFFTEVDPKWKNVFTVRAGGEYLKETGIGTIPLRTGVGYIPLPAPNTDSKGQVLSQARGFAFSLGTGIHWSQIHLDWAYTFNAAKLEREGFEQKSRNHHFNFTFTGYF
jgi:long-subunit fatty acid transport protein